ncbi:PspA/IM30 family protein [Specibacter sp. RAF43]|uniref:PspA/IM30 family protein n=1 Tax=Specibacter sp. RAF43 TaxID=3233057 RepID=UPI003F94DDF4
MGLFRRLAAAISPRRARASDADRLTIADAQFKQLEAVQRMRRGVADVAISRQRLDLQAAELRAAMDSLRATAATCRAAGDDGSAQTALARHTIMGEQYADLIGQRDALAEQESMLTTQLAQLQARVAGFNVTAETLRAARAAADARRRIAQSLDDLTDP